MTKVKEITINRGDDVILAREYAREMAHEIGFDLAEQTQIGTAASELSRNVHQFAGNGKVTITEVVSDGIRGIAIVVEDRGPGISDIEQAMQDGFSTNNGLGFGLPGARRLMDEFEIESRMGVGTTVKIKKWLKIEDKIPDEASSDRGLGGLLDPNGVVDLSPGIISGQY
jgi:serine/threonine-protein kinase RsbT